MLKNILNLFADILKKILMNITNALSKLLDISIHLLKNIFIRVIILCLITLVLGLWIGKTFLLDQATVTLVKNDKEVEVDKTGAISIKLPGIKLDEDAFQFKESVLQSVPVEIPIPGKLVFNAERTKVLSARVAGRVERIYAFDGAKVKAGQSMAEFFSPDYVSAQQEFILSLKTSKALDQVAFPSLFEDAKGTLEASANRLRILGGADEDINYLRKGGQPTPTFPMRSPIDGVVIKRMVDPGAFMNVGDVLATIADPRALWFMGNVYEQDIRKIAPGQILKLRSESFPDREFIAKANYVSPTIDPVTHALLIRCDVDNADGALRPEMFVNGRLEVAKSPAVVIPRAAVIQVRNLKFVIVQSEQDTYRRLPVKGFEVGDNSFAVTEGLNQGDKVMVMGATLMNQRFLKQED